MTTQDKVERIKAQIAEYSEANKDFPEVRVLDEDAREDLGWLYVPVARKAPGTTRAFPYYDHLFEIEKQLETELGVHVLLIPARDAA